MKVTQEQVIAAIRKVTYTLLPDGITTICQITLPNGYTVIGKSACADPTEFSKELGEAWAFKDAKEQVWPLLGYELRDKLHKNSDIARVAHEVNRAYCQALGDMSQPTWEDAPAWQKTSALMGVAFHIGADHGPAASHMAWMEVKRADGWKWGPVKDEAKKEHPCFVPYEELPQEQRAKDYLFRAVVHALR